MRREVLLLVGLGACGRLGFDGLDSSSGSHPPPSGMVQTHLATAVCAVQTWSTIAFAQDADLAVASTPTGATLFAVPASGGNLTAFSIDALGNATTPQTTIRTGGPYTASAASYVDGTLIAAVISGTRTLVNTVPSDLSAYTEIANVDGESVAKDALLHASADRITPTACSAGFTVNPFDNSWNPTTSQFKVTTGQSMGLAAAPLDGDAIVAWPTASACYVERVTSMSTGTGSMQNYACSAPRLVGVAPGMTILAFEASDGVRVTPIASDQLTASTQLIAPGAKSPRIVFDGTYPWVSYLDAGGEIEVGFLDGSGKAVSTTLAGTAPTASAYELSMIGGSPWIVAVDAAGVTGYQLCIDVVPGA